MSPKDTLQLAYSVLTENQKKRFEMDDELDFSFGIQNLARFRGNCFKQRGCVSMVIRQIPFTIKTFEDLGLPDVIRKMAEQPARTGAGDGTDRLGQVHDARRDDRQDQQGAERATSSRSKTRSSSSTAIRAASSTSARSGPTRRASRPR